MAGLGFDLSDAFDDPKPQVDAVVTWVDGADPAHRAKLLRYRGADYHNEAWRDTRFDDSGELRFCLASIALFAPFVRYVYLVTDDQSPAFLDDLFRSHSSLKDRIKVVDHTDIFSNADYLPTFNSIAIEAAMHRIDGLSERFIYFNDDFFLARPLSPSYFFDEKGPILRGDFKKYYDDRISYRIKSFLDPGGQRAARPGFITSQQLAARLAWNEARYLQVGHAPHPLRRSTIASFYEKRPQVMDTQLRHRFRHPDQISTISAANHVELRAGTAKVEPALDIGYIKPSRALETTIETFAENLAAGRFASVCVQSLDEFSKEHRAALLAVLEGHYFARSNRDAGTTPLGADDR